MGVRKLVPSLSSFLKTNFISKTKPENISDLYIDCNSLFHPKAFEEYERNKVLHTIDPLKVDELIIINIIKYIDELIISINPSNLVYLAVDGVAPKAKMKQQMYRKYKTLHDNEFLKELHKKYNEEYFPKWNNAKITPGTLFMEKLTNALLNYINNPKHDKYNYNIYFSSSYTPNEGEHKILHHIKKNKQTDNPIVIYGLDSDLLFLSLSTLQNNIYIMRDNNSEITFLEINNIILEITNYCSIKEFIFVCSMLGNDFLPHLLSVNLNYNDEMNGINIIMFLIEKHSLKDKIIENDIINYDSLLLLFREFTLNEESYFKSIHKRKPFIRHGKTMQHDIENRENLNFEIPDIFQLNDLNIPINLSKQYYYNYYGITNIDDACEKYIMGLFWNYEYYLHECPDYLWSYKYFNSPFVSDIYNWLLNNKELFLVNRNHFRNRKDCKYLLTAFDQLIMTMPIQNHDLLPKSIFKVMINNPTLFPRTVKMDLQLIHKYWQAYPMIELIDIITLKNISKNLYFTNEEIDRNSFKKIFIKLKV